MRGEDCWTPRTSSHRGPSLLPSHKTHSPALYSQARASPWSILQVPCELSRSVVSDSLRPHGLQPPGSSVLGDKHEVLGPPQMFFLTQVCMSAHSVMSDSSATPRTSLPGASVRGFPRQEYCHFFLQEIFPTKGSNLLSPALAGRFFTAEPPGKEIQLTWDIRIKKKKISQMKIKYFMGSLF